MSVDRCIMCGAPVPEGSFVCPICEYKSYRKDRIKSKNKRRDKSKEDFDEESERLESSRTRTC